MILFLLENAIDSYPNNAIIDLKAFIFYNVSIIKTGDAIEYLSG